MGRAGATALVKHVPQYLSRPPMRGPQDIEALGWSSEGALLLWEHRFDRDLPARFFRLPRPRQESPRRKRKGIPKATRKAVFERDAYRCVKCNDWHDLEIDHVIPHWAGGSDDTANLQTLCGPCNRAKGGSQ